MSEKYFFTELRCLKKHQWSYFCFRYFWILFDIKNLTLRFNYNIKRYIFSVIRILHFRYNIFNLRSRTPSGIQADPKGSVNHSLKRLMHTNN